MHSKLHFQIKELRAQNTQKALEAIMVTVAAFMVLMLLPSLIVQYFYADQQLLEAPKVLEYIPVGAFLISMLYFIYVVVGNIMRGMKIKNLKMQCQAFSDFSDDKAEEMISKAELKKAGALVDQAMSEIENKAKRPAKMTRRSSSSTSAKRRSAAKKK